MSRIALGELYALLLISQLQGSLQYAENLLAAAYLFTRRQTRTWLYQQKRAVDCPARFRREKAPRRESDMWDIYIIEIFFAYNRDAIPALRFLDYLSRVASYSGAYIHQGIDGGRIHIVLNLAKETLGNAGSFRDRLQRHSLFFAFEAQYRT